MGVFGGSANTDCQQRTSGFVVLCHLPHKRLKCSISQDMHVGDVSSSSLSLSTTTITPFLIEQGTNGVKSRALRALNVSSSRFPPFLRNSFVENWAIKVSVSVQFFTCEIMSSGSTFLWMTKVIRERTIGEVNRTLMRLGGWAPMCCSSTRNSVKRGQRLKLGRSLENCSSAPLY